MKFFNFKEVFFTHLYRVKTTLGVSTSIVLVCLLCAAPASAYGIVLGTAIGGYVLAKKAGGEVQKSIDRAEAAANALLGKADDIAKLRLVQLDGIINNAVDNLIGKGEQAALKILAQAKKDIDALEKQIFNDVKKAIWEFECASRRVVLGDLGTALGGLGDILGTNQIRLTPAERVIATPSWYTGCFWWCQDPYVVDIMEPFGETYIRVRNLMEGAITSEQVDDDTPANHLVGTYEYLSNFALKTSCFYSGSEDRYNREYVDYREAARKWRNVVEVPLD